MKIMFIAGVLMFTTSVIAEDVPTKLFEVTVKKITLLATFQDGQACVNAANVLAGHRRDIGGGSDAFRLSCIQAKTPDALKGNDN